VWGKAPHPHRYDCVDRNMKILGRLLLDALVKRRKFTTNVIPAKAGIQIFEALRSKLRRIFDP